MKVLAIQSRQFLGDYKLQSAEIVPEWIGFLVRTAVPIFAPTILYCVLSLQLWPLYVMSGVVTIGVMIGTAMFYWPGEGYLQSIFETGIPSAPSGTREGGLKMAA